MAISSEGFAEGRVPPPAYLVDIEAAFEGDE
jgi:hypothetical protein